CANSRLHLRSRLKLRCRPLRSSSPLARSRPRHSSPPRRCSTPRRTRRTSDPHFQTLSRIGSPTRRAFSFLADGMKRILPLLLLALVAPLLAEDRDPAKGIVFCSYNVRNYLGRDQVSTERRTKAKPEKEIEALIKVIREI